AARGRGRPSGGEDSSVRRWAAAPGRGLPRRRAHKGWVTAVAFGPGGRRLASASEDRSVRLWGLPAGDRPAAEPLVLQGHTAGVLCVALSGDGRHVASGGWDRTPRPWDAAPRRPGGPPAGPPPWGTAGRLRPDRKR